MTKWNVLENLKRLMPMEEEVIEKALPICSQCLEEIRENLRDDADENDKRIAVAAAGLAYYQLMIASISADDAVTSFRAGDVTVSKNPVAIMETAANIRDEALARAVPVLKDRDFLFRQVGI